MGFKKMTCFLKPITIIKRGTGTGMKNLGHFVTFYMNLHTRSRSQALKLGLQLHPKVAAQPAPAPQH
jgi:hypothetical protein